MNNLLFIEGEIMNYYDEIKNKLINNEIYEKVKDYSKERNRVKTYFEIGKLLSKAGSKYGESIIENYSQKLVIEVGKKYNARTLRSMRQLYVMFNDDFWKPVVSKLSWTSFLLIMPLKEQSKKYYYANLCINYNLSKRQLQEKIKSKEYERLDEKIRSKLINQEQTIVSDFIKNPILIKNSYNYTEISEKILKKLILEDMDNFLTELGEGFCYIKSEYKIKLCDRYNYIDLLLYNIKYKCYAVVELKVTELKKEYIGQIQTYMNYIDRNIKTIEEDKTIGIIIVKKDNKFIMEYCSDSRIFRTTYIL
jgi:predicted nuclease of restriction endonuclease-like (RecB) superfamily